MGTKVGRTPDFFPVGTTVLVFEEFYSSHILYMGIDVDCVCILVHKREDNSDIVFSAFLSHAGTLHDYTMVTCWGTTIFQMLAALTAAASWDTFKLLHFGSSSH